MSLFKTVEAYINRVGLESSASVFGVTPARVKQVLSTGQATLAMFEKVMAEEKLILTPEEPLSINISLSKEPETDPYQVAEYPQWSNRKLAILSCTNRSYDHVAMGSINKLMDPKLMTMHTVYSNFGIVRGRNQLADWFLRSNLEWSFWVDDDMILQCGDSEWFKREVNLPNMSSGAAGLHTIFQLLSRNKTIVGGCYFGRAENGQPVTSAKSNNHFTHQCRLGPVNMIVPTAWVGFGAVLIHRKVFEDIITKFPDIRIKDDNLAKAYGYRYGFFDSLEYTLGEDISFCKRAEEAGHKTHVDLMVMPGHVGRYVFNYQNTQPQDY